MDYDEIGVVKYGNVSTLLFGGYGATAPSRTHNVTLVLALTGRPDGLLVSASVLDKENGNAVLWQGSLLDGPGVDADIPGPPLDRLIDWSLDSGVPYTSVRHPWIEVWQDAEGPPPPVEVIVDNFEYDLYDAPALSVAKSVLLAWSMDSWSVWTHAPSASPPSTTAILAVSPCPARRRRGSRPSGSLNSRGLGRGICWVIPC